jgi:hypothetical protein
LTACPGTPLAGHWLWWVVGRAFGACCFAGKLRSPAPPTGRRPHPAQLGGLDPYVNGYVNPYVVPYALGVRTLGFDSRGYRSSAEALRGEWSGRAVWCASRD